MTGHRQGHRHPRPARQWIVIVTAAGATAAVAGLTHPFTLGADVVTAIPILIGLLVLVPRLRRGHAPTAVVATGQGQTRPDVSGRWSLVWLGLVAAVAAWEVYTFLGSPRSAHPTLSVLFDMLDATWVGKFVAFFLWLALGWYLVDQ
jgi:hypothetical protein